jgi:uncharacterized protein (DUF305 family)
MSKDEQAHGASPQATALAVSIATSQAAEIDRMSQILAILGS